jgi:hypothetical protein
VQLCLVTVRFTLYDAMFCRSINKMAITATFQKIEQLWENLMPLETSGDEESWRRLVLEDELRNEYNFTNKGARWSKIRRLSLQIKYKE